jgi:hypothetical protein
MEAEQDPSQDFPLHDAIEDAAGNERSFVIISREAGSGFELVAQEQGKEGLGYEFSAFSETSPYHALGSLRGKMRRSLATRHITRHGSHYLLLHDTLRGRISWDQDRGLVLIVDGIALTLEEMGKILEMHEGWQCRLQIADASADISN